MKNKTKKADVEWWDDETTDTVVLAAKEYGVEIKCRLLDEASGGKREVVTVEGPAENVQEFLDDVDDGDVRPMCRQRGLSGKKYQEWLVSELAKAGLEYAVEKA